MCACVSISACCMRDGRRKSRPGLSGSAWCGPSGLSKFAASLELLAAVAGYGYVQGSLLCMLPWTAGTSWPCMVPTRFRKCPAGSYCSTLWVSLSGTLFLGELTLQWGNLSIHHIRHKQHILDIQWKHAGAFQVWFDGWFLLADRSRIELLSRSESYDRSFGMAMVQAVYSVPAWCLETMD